MVALVGEGNGLKLRQLVASILIRRRRRRRKTIKYDTQRQSEVLLHFFVLVHISIIHDRSHNGKKWEQQQQTKIPGSFLSEESRHTSASWLGNRHNERITFRNPTSCPTTKVCRLHWQQLVRFIMPRLYNTSATDRRIFYQTDPYNLRGASAVENDHHVMKAEGEFLDSIKNDPLYG